MTTGDGRWRNTTRRLLLQDRVGGRARRDHRPGLRRPAPGPGLRRPRDRRPGLRRRPRQGRQARARRELHRPHPRADDPADARAGLRGDDRLRPARRARRRHHLRPDAADRRPRARPDLRRQVGRGHRRAAAARPACRPGEHHLSRHHPRRRPADPRGRRPRSRAATSSWPSAPSARTRATPSSRRRPSPRSSAASTRPAWSWPPRSTAKVVVQVVPVSSPEVAEACKILENTYRAVNIALVNELKVLYDRMGIDVWEVIEAAKTKPFGFQAFYPGPGPGRALHPDRPVLPDLGGPQARPDHPVHRAGRRDQHVDARLRRRARSPTPSTTTASRSRGARSPCWAWPTRRTSTTPASRPASS